jgi:hypothetical protein
VHDHEACKSLLDANPENESVRNNLVLKEVSGIRLYSISEDPSLTKKPLQLLHSDFNYFLPIDSTSEV